MRSTLLCTLLIILVFLYAAGLHASEKLDPFSAAFTVLTEGSPPWTDIGVVLDFSIHNPGSDKLLGSKFVSMEDIDSVRVTDGQGRRLPFTIKKYPRNRIIWEYGAAQGGIRTVKIEFVIRNAVKKQAETLEISLDWIGGWTRDVLNTTYSIVLPGIIDADQIISVFPEGSQVARGEQDTRITFAFKELKEQTLKVVLQSPLKNAAIAQKEGAEAQPDNDPEESDILEEPDEPEAARAAAPPPVKQKSVEQKPAPVQAAQKKQPEPKAVKTAPKKKPPKPEKKQAVLSKIRYAPHTRTKDRIVFDLDRPAAYTVTHAAGKKEIEIAWKEPLTVASAAGVQKKLSSQFIRGLYWRKAKNKELSCVLQLKQGEVKVTYGELTNPPRIYVDVYTEEKKAVADAQQQPRTEPAAAAVQKPAVKEETIAPPAEQAASLPAAPPAPVTSTPSVEQKPAAPLAPAQSFQKPVTAYTKREPPIEEKIAYRKAIKLITLGSYLEAIDAFNLFLQRYPRTSLKEDVLFESADCYFKMASEKEPKYYSHAVDAYKVASASFPQSEHTPRAAFQIGECQRRQNFFLEAKSQYQLVADQYPKSPWAVESRYWIAECFYQMNNYTEALKGFISYVDDFPSGPYQKESGYRIGDCYFQIKDFDRAEFYYEKAIKRWPDLTRVPLDSLNNMAKTDYYKGNFERCREAFLLSFNLYPLQEERGQLLRFIGDSFQWEGDMQKALNVYGLLVYLYPESSEAMIAAMRIGDLGVNVKGLQSENIAFQGLNPYQDPEAVYRWIIEHDEKGSLLTEAYYKLGYIMAERHDYKEAVDLFKRAMYQKERGVYYKKAFDNVQKILVRMIEQATAREDYFTVVELYKRNEPVFLKQIDDCGLLYNVGQGYLEQGLLNEAEGVFNRIIGLNMPGNVCSQQAEVCLSRVDIERGDLEKAEDRLRILLFSRQRTVEPEAAEAAYHVLGDIYYLDERYQKAVEAYSIPLKRKDRSYRFAKSLFRLGVSFGKTGYQYNAIQTLKRMIAVQGQISSHRREMQYYAEEARLLMGDYFFEEGNYESATAIYRGLAQGDASENKKGWALARWGEIMIKTGDPEGALKVFGEIVDKMPYTFLGTFAKARIEEIKWRQSAQPEMQL